MKLYFTGTTCTSGPTFMAALKENKNAQQNPGTDTPESWYRYTVTPDSGKRTEDNITVFYQMVKHLNAEKSPQRNCHFSGI